MDVVMLPQPQYRHRPLLEEIIPVPEALERGLLPDFLGISYREGCLVALEDLALLRLQHHGYDGLAHIGEIIAHRKVAEELQDIFTELRMGRFPIERMHRIDRYGADDDRSMTHNNTSFFCQRTRAHNGKASYHELGCAGDLNPFVNPDVHMGKDGIFTYPAAARMYADRTLDAKGMIRRNDFCYDTFDRRGWKSGIAFSTHQDHQHFEKHLPEHDHLFRNDA